jgi:hypothetical protein
MNKTIKLLCFLLFLLLLGCTQFDTSNNYSGSGIHQQNQVTVNFIGHWYGEGLREQMVRDMARAYEFEHQEITVNLKFPDEIYYDRSDFLSNQKFVASIVRQENPAWDIIYINNAYQQVADLMGDPDWAAKYLVDFSQYPEFKNNMLPELVGDSVKKIWKGIIPGPFLEGANWALWCNNSVADKLGIQVKPFDMTFDDLLSYAQAAENYNSSHSDKITLFYESDNWKTYIALAIQLFASKCENTNEFLDLSVSERKLTLWYETLKSLEQLAVYHPMVAAEKMKNWDSGAGMLEDKYLFFSNGSWMYNIWLSKDPEKLKQIMPTEYPVFKPVKIYVGGYLITWAVLKNSPHRDEAVKFLLSLATPDIAEQWIKYTKCPTGIKTKFESNFGVDDFEAFTNHIAKKYGTKKYGQTNGSEFMLGDINRGQPNYYEEVLTGKLTADEAMRKIRASIRWR